MRRFFIATGTDVLTAMNKDRTATEMSALADKVDGWIATWAAQQGIPA